MRTGQVEELKAEISAAAGEVSLRLMDLFFVGVIVCHLWLVPLAAVSSSFILHPHCTMRRV
jgi:hypothetical protein